MRLCCGNGKPYDTLTDIEKLGCYSTDHCVGPISVEDYDLLLTGLGTFHTNECTSSEDLAKLIKQSNWEKWIASQIEEEGFDKYKDWYAKMLQRGAICNELAEAHNKLLGTC